MLGGIAAFAFLVRFVPVVVSGDLFGIFSYDDGVYFGSAVAMVHGRIPYRDFLLLHPPRVLYLTAPFAMLGHLVGDAGAFGAARVAFMALGALNAVLVMLVAGTWGRAAAVAAGVLYAVWPASVVIERTTWLVGPQNTLLLLTLLVLLRRPWRTVGPRRAAVVGALGGAGFALQIWAVVPIAAVLVWLLLADRRAPGGPVRSGVAYVAGAALAAGLAWLPFLIAAAEPMVRYVVLDQIGRPPASGSMIARLRAIEGLPRSGVLVERIPGALVVLVFVAASAVVTWAAWRRRGLRLPVGLATAQLLVLAVVPPFGHYAAWVTPAGAVGIGGAVAELTAVTKGRRLGRRLLWAGYAGALVVLLAFSSLRGHGRSIDVAGIRAATDDARCVAADSPAVLMAAGLLDRTLHDGCPLLLDPTGTSYDLGRGTGVPRRELEPYQAAMTDYYANADAVLLIRTQADAFSPATWAAIRARFCCVSELGPVTVLTR